MRYLCLLLCSTLSAISFAADYSLPQIDISNSRDQFQKSRLETEGMVGQEFGEHSYRIPHHSTNIFDLSQLSDREAAKEFGKSFQHEIDIDKILNALDDELFAD